MSLRLRILGAASLLRGDELVAGAASQRQSLALLAVLAAHEPRGIAREKLAALLWPESTEAQSRNNLKQAIHVLRRELGSDAVLGTAAMRVNVELISCDLCDFERLRAALQLERAVAAYGGALLDGFHIGGDSEEFERWCDDERGRLAREFAESLDALATNTAARGDDGAALALWRRLAEADPLNGRAARGIAQALVAEGDLAGALRHAENYRESLHAELGLPVDPALEALIKAIRAGAPAAEVPALTIRPREVAASLDVPPRRTRRRTAMSAVAIGSTLALVVLLVRCGEVLAPPTYDPRRVVVTAFARESDDPAATSTRRLIAEGIAGRLTSAAIATPTVLLTAGALDSRDAAMRERAGLVISLSSVPATTGVAVSAELTDVTTGHQLWSAQPVSMPNGADAAAVDALAERAAAAVAVRLDPYMLLWIAHSSQPSSLESYREFRLGMESYVNVDPSAALPHFLAAARDSSFTMALVLAAWSEYYAGNGGGAGLSAADSIVAVLRPRQLAPLDRAMVEHQAARFNGNLAEAYNAAAVVAAAAPGSEWRYLLAESALEVGRANEAARVFQELGPDLGFLKGFQGYWNELGRALHLAGEHQRELVAMKEARRRFPTDRIISQAVVRALAAAGREGELNAELDRALTFKQKSIWSDNQPMETAVLELRAHGHADAAERVADRIIEAIGQQPAAERKTSAGYVLSLRYEAGQLPEARSLLEQLSRENPAVVDPMDRALISAAAGDGSVARRLDAQLASETDPRALWGALFGRAQLAASVGDRDGAVRWLQDSYRAGNPWRSLTHLWPAFDAMRGYAPFDALAGTVD